jgi:stress-induced morphogen
MFRIKVDSPLFAGKTRVEQHRMVNEALKSWLSGAHGYNLTTGVPPAAAGKKD